MTPVIIAMIFAYMMPVVYFPRNKTNEGKFMSEENHQSDDSEKVSDHNLKKISIKGKDYVLTNERIRVFREMKKYIGFSLITEWLDMNDQYCTAIAKIINPDGNVIATGTAWEERKSSFVNKTSYIENCETSAWGRALANLGIGVDTSIATFEEVANAMNNQKRTIPPTEKQIKLFKMLCSKLNKEITTNTLKWIESISATEMTKAIDSLQKEAGISIPKRVQDYHFDPDKIYEQGNEENE